MKITDVKTILLSGPCTNDPFLSELRTMRSAAFIRIETDTEIYGTGETYAGYFFPEGVPPIVEFFKPVLVGQTVDDIDLLWQRMYHAGNFWCRVGLGAIVLAGIEAALWDLRGKELKTPVYKLLQQKWSTAFSSQDLRSYNPESPLPCYATGGPSNFPLERLGEKVAFYMEEGFKGVKIGAGAFGQNKVLTLHHHPERAAAAEVEKAAFIRRQFGPDLWLMLDAHMGNSPGVTWGLETALAVCRALEPYGLLFLEEPLHYTRPDWYATLSKSTSVPVAGGECLTAVCEWQAFIDQECFHIGQPDASFTSGLNPFMDVASRLSQRGLSIATHAWGAGASLMQNVHAGFACANTRILEIAPAYGPLHAELIGDSLQIRKGYVSPPETPGLGIDLKPGTIERYPFIPGTGEFNSVPGKVLTT